MEPGVYIDMPSEEYHADPAISVSFLKQFAVAPAKARFGQRVETPALRRGTLVHCAVLEPAELEQRFCPTALERRGTKAWDAEELAAGGRELVKSADWNTALRMRDAVAAYGPAAELLGAIGPVEQSMCWIDPDTGVTCRGRPDKLALSFKVIVDVKTTADASPAGFGRQADNLHYPWQAAYYTDGMTHAPGGFRPDAFVFLAIESVEPFLVAAYQPTTYQISSSRLEVRNLLQRVKECLRTDIWPGYSPALEDLELPAWRTPLAA